MLGFIVKKSEKMVSYGEFDLTSNLISDKRLIHLHN